MGAGRFVCVALPLALTIGSIICLLIAMLAGITDQGLSMFEVRTQNLSISSNSLGNLANVATRGVDLNIHGLTGEALNNAGGQAKSQGEEIVNNLVDGENITAKSLGLADYYRVSLWNYCAFTDGKRNCTKARFDWAHDELNTTDKLYTVDGSSATVSLPKEIKTALNTFSAVSKWTQVVYIVAIIAAGVELIFGLFAICSRIGSCCTVIVCAIATAAIMGASVLATVQASVVTGAIKSTARAYNVQASINTKFLSITWLAVAFSMAAGLFWLFTMCCCASDNKSSKKSSGGSRGFGPFGNRASKHSDQEKLIPTGSYQRVGDDNTAYHGQQSGHEYGVPMHNVQPMARGGNGAYEPYSHARV